MRLKNFQAQTMAEAMELVRESLGANAIIVSTNEDDNGGGVRITAAVEQEDPETILSPEPALDLIDLIGEALDRHGTPIGLSDQILSSISLLNQQDPAVALASALDMMFAFKSLGERDHSGPLIFIGPPGSGKTVTIAKLAAAALLEQVPVKLITTDTLRAGAIEQFKSYGERLGIIAEIVDDPATLTERVNQRQNGTLTLVDTTSTNPLFGRRNISPAGFLRRRRRGNDPGSARYTRCARSLWLNRGLRPHRTEAPGCNWPRSYRTLGNSAHRGVSI
ncbi:MAG TPA: hypothetical protein DCE33_08580 [Rhodospirillaceae bacterium]|nr:hypothetical protein [Rhodospirillaceae bacterium]